MRATQGTPLLSSLLLLSSLAVANAGLVAKRALTVPATLPGAWQYEGCYTDIGRTIDAAEYTDDANMTIESCIAFCTSKGFQYAGVEYFHECYCGSSLAATAAKVAETDCSDACAGNANEPCGGASRLNIFYSSVPVGPQPNPGVNGWSYIGCYSEGATGRTLSYGVGTIPSANMTVALCTTACKAAGYILAGVEYSGECYCGNTISGGGAPATDGCDMLCNGNQTEICGGASRLNVYDYLMQYPVSSSTKTSTATTVSSSTKTSTSTTLSTSKTTVTSSVSTSKTATSTSSVSTSKTTSTSSVSTSKTATTSTSSVSTSKTTSTSSVSTSKTATTSTSSVSTSKTATTSSVSTSKTATSTSTSSVSTSKTATTSTSSVSTSKTATTSTSSVSTSKTATTSTSISSVSTSKSATASTSTSSVSTSSVSTSKSTTASTSTSSVSTSSSTTTSSSATVVPTGPVQPATVNGYTFYGCQTEATSMRALSGATTALDTMTLELCQAFCSASGYTYFGVEYARECYCGNSFNAGSVAAPASDCNFLCAGNSLEYCGAGNRLSVYANNGAIQSSSSSTASSSTGVSTGSTTKATSSSTTSAVATSTGFPTGWSYQGCYVDGADGRILAYQSADSQTLTQQSCATLCAGMGYTISGTEYSVQCFCGDTLNNGAAEVLDTECTTACSGNSTQMCGAGGRMSIVSLGTPTVLLPPAVQTGGLNGSWAYQGCYEDNVNDVRTFFWQLYFPDTMTANQCLNRCALYGYMAAGLEYGDECYCGDPANIATTGATLRPDTECNVLCAGNSSAYCGGGSRLSTYFWTGTPFYTWDFPQDYRAGEYQFLIGGVTIPLMTMEGINGKISFISKWGTGPANETGAYELDLTLLSDPTKAWRALHLKTDVFCAAGIVLPDKGGRQLTIGGWSGESTEGVRLYWPDGTAGVPGTRDWQENVNELALQAGRWYPSAMVMANGSIMVIGGEVGSNGAAVPSIEILPYTGTAPLYMDWLDRTNPNNLYPFTCVLPSGGIFVAYYNEARILDEQTFATVKTLPNAPGAVNDDLGGRTYPLEGAAVLLPQRAPYSDPLGVLICGGSTNGVSNAIDNCVSTQPDAASPTWTLERLPSFRVMPCMAPLPDGTYLIANGAEHGVAGFGLATNPNLNALLYDPTKAVGSRITVMANTTIARLYHSEAITLLDGRVLISGSNPEDGVHPEEYRIEVFMPPYLLSGQTRPTFTLTDLDWTYGGTHTFTLGHAAVNGAVTVTLLGAVGSTHGNSMGARTLMPAVTCAGLSCTVTAPPSKYICPPGWYQFFVLDGGIPAVGVYVRIGGDPASLGNWPKYSDFTIPGV